MKTADSVFRIAVAVTGHCVFCIITVVTEWLGSQVVSVLDLGQKGCQVRVLGKLFTPNMPLFTKQRNW